MPNTFEVKLLQQPDSLASAISEKFVTWENARQKWYRNAKETLQNLYATSTTEIYNQTREFDNSTHIPKITQIRDMLVTYYLDAMFSLPDYVEWEAYSADTVSVDKKNLLKSTMKQMIHDSNFQPTIRELVEDYVDYGNAFATAITVTGNGYTGPKAIRLDPLNMYFDPLASSFESSPKIIRSIKTIGELLADAEDMPAEAKMYKDAVLKAVEKRTQIRNTLSTTTAESIIDDNCRIAGFESWSTYYSSDTVELLTFYGDLYDIEKNKLHRNVRIVIMDRCSTLLNEPIKDYGFKSNILKAGWRDRKNNLWSMSPLDNIKGLQFMVDFLENKRADIFNFISNPVWLTKGDVEMPDNIYPGCQIGIDTDGDFRMLTPDATALQADLYIDRYMTQMEEMAGTPREAMGFRTPGEKTAFEVSQLNTASSRLFNEKTRKFELEMLEPLLTLMMRMYLSDTSRVVKVKTTNEDGVIIFKDVSLSDLSSDGRFVAVGSSTYTEKARLAQTLLQIYNSAIISDPLVSNYFDPKVIAKAITYTTGLDKFEGILKENARTDAQLTMARAQEYNQQQLEEEQVRGITNAQQGIV